MPEVYYTNDPTVSDIVVFNLVTTDTSDNPIDPYKINEIIIYFIEKGYEKHIITDTFLNYEMYNCIRYSKMTISPYMNELYLPNIVLRLKIL
jgi:hypothetical protein